MSERKRRTREHIIADLAVNFVQRLALESGFVVEERTKSDYGYDLELTTFDDQGYVEQGIIHLQVKATDDLARFESNRETLNFPIDTRDRSLWQEEPMPVFLILYDALRREGYWVYLQAYFQAHSFPQLGAKTLTVKIPKKNIVDGSTIRLMRDKKAAVLNQMGGVRHE
jgi:hypothetical protein